MALYRGALQSPGMSRPEPLVSVGIPTYNRPDGLARTLARMRGQSHANLEIVVSDNASTDPRVREVLDENRGDPRVKVFLQPENRGPVANFNFVLEQARGEYFVWAADDDDWSDTFITDCLKEFDAAPPGTVAVGLEAQYVRNGERLEFFPEGRPFYDWSSDRPEARLRHMLRHNYGNLLYGLFRREALFQNGRTLFQHLDIQVFNEIPALLFVMRQGNWRVSPRIGLYKTTSDATYVQARWEMEGGRLPRGSLTRHLRSAFGEVLRYHCAVLEDVLRCIGRIEIGRADALQLKAFSCIRLGGHFLACLFRRKRPAF